MKHNQLEIFKVEAALHASIFRNECEFAGRFAEFFKNRARVINGEKVEINSFIIFWLAQRLNHVANFPHLPTRQPLPTNLVCLCIGPLRCLFFTTVSSHFNDLASSNDYLKCWSAYKGCQFNVSFDKVLSQTKWYRYCDRISVIQSHLALFRRRPKELYLTIISVEYSTSNRWVIFYFQAKSRLRPPCDPSPSLPPLVLIGDKYCRRCELRKVLLGWGPASFAIAMHRFMSKPIPDELNSLSGNSVFPCTVLVQDHIVGRHEKRPKLK